MKYSKFIVPILFIGLMSCKNNKKATTEVNHDDFKTIYSNFKLTSIAIENGVLLDAYKCEEKINDVENSIPLSWENVPEGTKSLAVVMYHYPKKDDKTEINSYLLLWDINPETTEIPYKMASKGNWFMGANKDGTAISYTSPCSRGKGEHEYTIALYALSETPASLPKKNSLNVDYNVFMNALATVSIIDRTTLTFIDSN
ncbi:YbhB/YbcL family Raf kinase inhibitor-like protein [Cellulophaga sp. HaHaR_3_176]|uniref:YbhB/YbcL family Raf kinase inhibitor-like protein n=1 Tax=Cellulophaga sp. HaHaR_3_176 TaxID=1942464 RepID=UPI001C1F7897|nr:YbhB/YbcL family Raf kinase inhibitor-like protein [Cellulophaga sp. HaHaR_3_176]QWX85205.1 YbhB/YbcL family Raf kinase inhibitor-like protein [Cellulophaga sp. HaHaR_3_176]